MKIAEIAEKQQIPLKFLEAILNHLEAGGSFRAGAWKGAIGWLDLPKKSLWVRSFRFVDGPIAPVDCVSHSRPSECTFHGECPFFELWSDVRLAISNVVDRISFEDLVERNRSRSTPTIALHWDI